MIDNKKQLIKGGINYSIRQVIVILLNIFTALILTRHFAPEDFGIIAFITVIGGFIQVISDGGMGLYLVRSPGELKDKEISEVTLYQLLIFIIITILLMLIIGVNYVILNNNAVMLYVAVSSIAIPFSIIRSAYFIKFERNLDFASIAIVEIIEQLIFSMIAISLSLILNSVWGIVFATVTKGLVGYLMAKRRGKIDFEYKGIKLTGRGFKRAVGNGLSYQIPSLLETARSAINPIWIGSLLGAANAGYVDRAVLVAGLPLMFLSAIWRKVMFPYFSKTQDENNHRKSALIKSIYLHSIIDKALYLPLVLFGTELVKVILGEKWLPILPVVYIMVIGNLLFASIVVNETAFLLSANKANILAKISILQLPLAWILTALLTKYYGILGYAFAAFSLWFFLIIIMNETKKILGQIMHIKIQWKIMISFLISAILMKYLLVKIKIEPNTIQELILASIALITLYLFILIIIDKKRIIEIIKILQHGFLRSK
jgi:O-antigen/teichoic acid export membrane protein